MAFGKFFLLPVIGSTLFGWLSYALKTAHNFAGPLFAVSLVIVFFTFLRDNFWRRADTEWMKKGGGLLKGHEPASHRFNAGEKLIFWFGVLLLGSIVVASGLVLDKLIPGLGETREQMQIAHMVHAVATTLHDGDVPGPHLHRHDRHARCLQRDAHRLRRTRPGRRSTTRCGPRTSAPGAFRCSARNPMAPCNPRRSRHETPDRAGRAGVASGLALAKLPPPSDEAKAKAAEAAAKTAWSNKVGAYQLCQVMDKVAAQYLADAKKAGKAVQPTPTPPCTDPGPFVYAAAETQADRGGGRALARPSTAKGPPSGKAPAAEPTPTKKP